MEIITQRLKLKDTPYYSKLSKKYKNIDKGDTEFIKKGIIPSDLQIQKGERAAISYITTKNPDRDREIVLPKGAILDDYNKHRVVLWGHDSKSPPIGVNMWVKADDKGLIAKTRYHDKGRGKEIYDLLLDEIPIADSIGFIPLSVIDKSEFGNIDKKALGLDGIDLGNVDRIYDKWLLLEDSKVSVPSNPEALQLVMSKGLIKENDLDKYYINDVGEYLGGVIPKEISQNSNIFEEDISLDEIKGDFGTVLKFQGSPRNPFGSHCSFQFKGGLDGYKKAWRLHFSQINGGALTPRASGPIRGTIRRIAMISQAMKPPCNIVDSERIGARSGSKSPLEGNYPEKPSDYGLSKWKSPSDENVDREKATQFTCSDLNIIKRTAVAEVKRRIKDREEAEKAITFSENDIDNLYDLEMLEINNKECNTCKLNLDEIDIDIEEKQEEPTGSFKYCVCKACGYSEEHKAGKPCQEKVCPKCGANLMGSNNIPEGKDTTVTKPEGGRGWDETDTSFRYRVRSPEDFQDGSFRTVPIKKTNPKINSVMGKLKNKTTMTLQSIIFPKSEKWTIETAKAWLNDHPDVVKSITNNDHFIIDKNYNLVTKEFSIGDLPSEPSTFYFDIYSKYLDCEVKNLYTTKMFFPNILKGMYLYALDKSISEYEVADERNFDEYKKGENPCEYETLALNSKESRDFLIEGIRFYDKELKFIIKYEATWAGEKITIAVDRKNKDFINKIINQTERIVKEENKLKGEAFCLNGEFLERKNRTFEDVILDNKIIKSIKTAINNLQNKREEMDGRGMMFIGYPGCLDGEVKVFYNRGNRKNGRWLSLEKLYQNFNSLNNQWDQSFKTRLQSYTEDGKVIWNEIVDVFDSGEKECYELVTVDGFSIIGTPDHPLLDETGKFKELSKFCVGDKILQRGSMCPRYNGGKKHGKDRPKRNIVWTSKYHPSLPLHKTVENGIDYFYNRIPYARCVVEADLNNVPVDKYIDILKTNEEEAKKMKAIPNDFDVHHIDENTLNDDIDNLLVLHHDEHAKLHSKTENFNTEYTVIGEVKDIKNVGIRHTYDIQMTNPNNNFVTDGLFFAHNTGKTLTGKVMMDTIKDHTFIWISSKDFGHMSVTQAISTGFSLARDLSPTILFLEDIDHWLNHYAVDLIKTEMDGIMENKGVLTILTTNHPKNFPNALLDRPGRFHDIIKFNIPDEFNRKAMIKKWCSEISEDTIDYLLIETKGYTGAYIKELIDFARMISNDTDIDLEYSLFISLEKIKEQKDLIHDIQTYGDEILNKDLIKKDLILKSGRIISAKNLTKIKAAYDALSEVIKIAESNSNNGYPDIKPGEDKKELDVEFSIEDINDIKKELFTNKNTDGEELDITADDIKEVVKTCNMQPLYNAEEEKKKIAIAVENAIAKALGKVVVIE